MTGIKRLYPKEMNKLGKHYEGFLYREVELRRTIEELVISPEARRIIYLISDLDEPAYKGIEIEESDKSPETVKIMAVFKERKGKKRKFSFHIADTVCFPGCMPEPSPYKTWTINMPKKGTEK